MDCRRERCRLARRRSTAPELVDTAADDNVVPATTSTTTTTTTTTATPTTTTAVRTHVLSRRHPFVLHELRHMPNEAGSATRMHTILGARGRSER